MLLCVAAFVPSCFVNAWNVCFSSLVTTTPLQSERGTHSGVSFRFVSLQSSDHQSLLIKQLQQSLVWKRIHCVQNIFGVSSQQHSVSVLSVASVSLRETFFHTCHAHTCSCENNVISRTYFDFATKMGLDIQLATYR